MARRTFLPWVVLLLVGCGDAGGDLAAERIATAQRFFQGVYGGDPSVVNELASEDVVVTYPIFAALFGAPVLQGRAAVADFATGFGSRWAEPHVVFHEALGDSERVVLVWSFRARNVSSLRPDVPATGAVQEWGGITLYRFDADGRIVAEIGEESEPGPMLRLADGARAR